MKIRDSVAFVAGANRGLGLVFAVELFAAGVRKVHAAARNPILNTLDGVGRVRLDVTKPGNIATAARQCADVNQRRRQLLAGFRFTRRLRSRLSSPV